MATKIIIDAGHGGYDNGASYNGRTEKDDNLRLALAVGDILSDMGYDVEYTRTDDVYNSPAEKARIGNASGADYFISLHRNSTPNANTLDGVQTLIYNDSGIKKEIAGSINDELEKVGYKKINIEQRPNLAVLRRTSMPAVLVETGFINSDKDNELFDTKFNETAYAIATGIDKILGEDAASKTANNSDYFNSNDYSDNNDIPNNGNYSDIDDISNNGNYSDIDDISNSDNYSDIDDISNNGNYSDIDDISNSDNYSDNHDISNNGNYSNNDDYMIIDNDYGRINNPKNNNYPDNISDSNINNYSDNSLLNNRKKYCILFGVFRTPAMANAFLNELANYNQNADIYEVNGLYHVRSQAFDSIDDVKSYERQLNKNGHFSLIVKI